MTLDLIIVLKDGEVHERGTHDELMRNEGLYYTMWMQQQHAAEEPTNTPAK